MTKPLAIREVKAAHVGKLVTISGVVIRATEVKPMASVMTYTCDTCGCETYQPVSAVFFLCSEVFFQRNFLPFFFRSPSSRTPLFSRIFLTKGYNYIDNLSK